MATQHILGAGAVGHLLACLQSKAEYPCELLIREAESSNGIVNYVVGEQQEKLALCYVSEPGTKINYLWLTVKAYQVEQALLQIRSNLHASSQVFLMQNGMGHLETAQTVLADVIPAENIFIAINTHGALLNKTTKPMLVRHTGEGTITVGNNYLSDQTRPIAPDELLSKQLNPVWCDDIEQALWLKLGVNAVINPLTALHQCRNGELLNKPELVSQTEQLMSEMTQFYATIGYDELAQTFIQQCQTVIQTTASNYSSMMLDVKHQRPTELNAITGYLLSRADSVRLVMQAHRSLFHRLQKN